MITKDNLKKYALNLMFEMSDKEYETLESEFGIILKQMELIDNIEGIDKIEPMIFPFVTYEAQLRKDEAFDDLSVNEVLQNTTHEVNDQVKVPKVVE